MEQTNKITDKTLLIVKVAYNQETNKPEYYWEFPDNCATTRMLGILDMVKFELLCHWEDHIGGFADKVSYEDD